MVSQASQNEQAYKRDNDGNLVKSPGMIWLGDDTSNNCVIGVMQVFLSLMGFITDFYLDIPDRQMFVAFKNTLTILVIYLNFSILGNQKTSKGKFPYKEEI